MRKPFYEDADVKLYHGDYKAVLEDIAQPFDLILTDLPYSDEVHKNSKRVYKEGIVPFIDFASVDEAWVAELFTRVSPLAKGWVISFLEYGHTEYIRKNTPEGLKFVRAGMWFKSNTAPHVNQDRPSQGWESIAMLHTSNHKGKYLWHGRKYKRNHSVFEYPFCTEGLHKTQKPLALMEELILLFSNPGMLVFDPCCGSGTTLLAAANLGRKAIGIELDEKHCYTIAKRLSQKRMVMV
jgi:site-specific DNA-methyltransferase (adenine-specific)